MLRRVVVHQRADVATESHNGDFHENRSRARHVLTDSAD